MLSYCSSVMVHYALCPDYAYITVITLIACNSDYLP
uniref:Uncharacterized protein n=1 Tax=Arundo donax TaxID=35708 RepID=A0A0A9FR85_ARUDO